MTVLSPLARGKGSWEGDLECTQPASVPKPVLKQFLDEDTNYLDKSVIHPIRVKSSHQQMKNILQEASNAKTPSSDTSFAEYLHSRVPSTVLSRPKTSKSQHRYASNPRHFQYKDVKHKRIKSAPVKCSSDFEGQLTLPKTYVTRKGALMLFTSPPNLAFSIQNDERCYFYDPSHVDTAQLALQEMRTLDHLTASVLKYGNQQQIFSKLASSKRSSQNNAKVGLLRYESDEGVDLRAQPGGDFFFYLKDVQAKASYRNLTRSPSYYSLTSEEATEDLNSVLKTYDDNLTESYSMLGESTVRDISVTGESTRDWVKSEASSIKVSQMTETPTPLNAKLASESRVTRPNTGRTLQSSSAARTTTPLSFKEIAASLKCAPYLGRPLSAAYPPSYHSYIPTPPPFEHFTHPSEDEGDSDDQLQEEDIRPSSSYSLKSQKSVRSQGAKSVQSDKSGRSQKSIKSAGSQEYQSPSSDQGEDALLEDLQRTSALSRASNRSGRVSRRTASKQEGDQDEEGILLQRSEVSGRSPISAGSRRSRVSWAGDQGLEEDDNFEDDDWRSEVIEMAASEKGDQVANPEDVDVDGAEVMEGEEALEEGEVMEENLALDASGDGGVLLEEEGSGDRKSGSRVSSASPRRIYTPRTRSSGRTTPIELEDQDQELTGERIPSAASRKSASRVSHPVSDGEADTNGEDQGGTWPTEDANEEVTKTSVHGEVTDKTEEENTELEPAMEDAEDNLETVEESREEEVVFVPVVPAEETEPIAIPQPEEILSSKTEESQKTKPKTMLLEESVVLDARESKMKKPVPPGTKKPDSSSSLKVRPTLSTGGAKKSALTPITMREKKPAPKEEPQTSAKSSPTPPLKPTKPTSVGSTHAAPLGGAKVKNEGKKSPRSGRKRGGGGGGGAKKHTFTGPELQFVGSMAIDPYAGKPSKEEVDDLVAEELAKELAAHNLVEDEKETKETEKEVEDEVDSLATDDEAIEMELKKTRTPSKKKESKKKLAKERAALKEARRLEKQRREEEMKALQEKKKLMEEERKRQDLEEEKRKQELAMRIEEAEREAEMAREAEEEAKRMMQDARRVAREEREAKRREDAEKRKLERERQREERKKMEELATQREKEMADNLASAEERRKMQEQARWEREERERLEQEERERLEEEELLRQEEEEERIRELERQAEKEAMERLVREREAAERMRQEAELERKKQEAEEERKRQAELAEKAKEEERLLLLKIEEEQRRQKELERIRQIQKLEEEARARVRKELERRRARAMRRREFNLEQQGHMNGLRRTQGMTKPWVFTYYVHWPRDTYERRLPSGDKKKKRGVGRPRAKTAPPMVAAAKPQTSDTAAGP